MARQNRRAISCTTMDSRFIAVCHTSKEVWASIPNMPSKSRRKKRGRTKKDYSLKWDFHSPKTINVIVPPHHNVPH